MQVCLNIEHYYWPKLLRTEFSVSLCIIKSRPLWCMLGEYLIHQGKLNVLQSIYLSPG